MAGAANRRSAATPNPHRSAYLFAVASTNCISSRSLFAAAVANKLVVATFKKANKYVEPSMTVVPGPMAAKAIADEAPPDKPTAEESITLSNGEEIQSARAGPENLAISKIVGNGFGLLSLGESCSDLPAVSGGVACKRLLMNFEGKALDTMGTLAWNASIGSSS